MRGNVLLPGSRMTRGFATAEQVTTQAILAGLRHRYRTSLMEIECDPVSQGSDRVSTSGRSLPQKAGDDVGHQRRVLHVQMMGAREHIESAIAQQLDPL